MEAVAIVLLNYNGIGLLKRFVPQLVENSDQHPIYLIDNGSSDDSIDWVKNNYASIHCILLTENLGYAEGYNKGLKQIKASLYILLNTDVWVTKNWIAPMLDHFKSHPNTAIAQPHIVDYTNKTYFEYAGAAGGFIDQYGFPYCRGRIFKHLEKDNGQFNVKARVFWASGACFFVRRSVFEDLGGFDTTFFAHQEEIDLCWRAQRKGLAIYAIGDSKVYHLGGGTLRQSATKIYLNHRNSLYLLIKNLPSKQLFATLLVRILLDGLAGVFYFIQGKWSYAMAIIRAHLAFYKNSASFFRQRPKSIPKHNYFRVKSIVFEHYLRGIKNFDHLKH